MRDKAAGFCHTDLLALSNEFDSELPFIRSHERDPFQAFLFKGIKFVGSLIADPAEGEVFIRFFHENKLHAVVKEWKMEQAEEMRQDYLAASR